MKTEYYQKSILDNGLTVVSEHIPSMRSVSLGVWIKAGTRHEDESANGVAHFLEHMMFKRTATRSARDIARAVESVGGYINAFTAREQTCYHIDILDENLPLAVDVLADILQRDGFPEDEFVKEKQIILDEIYAVDDSPEDLIHDRFVEKLFPENGLGYPILGTPETVQKMTLDNLMDYYRQNYVASNMVIAAAGNVNHLELLELIENHFRFDGSGQKPLARPPKAPRFGQFLMHKPIQQAHICLGAPALAYDHPQKYDLLILNTVLGGGMGARLFQNIREQHGLAYGIYSFLDFYHDAGLFGVYLGTDHRNLNKAVDLLNAEYHALYKQGIDAQELAEAKSQLRGSMVLSLENTTSRMNRLALLEIYFGSFRDIDNVLEDIDKVTRERVGNISEKLFREKNLVGVILSPDAGAC